MVQPHTILHYHFAAKSSGLGANSPLSASGLHVTRAHLLRALSLGILVHLSARHPIYI